MFPCGIGDFHVAVHANAQFAAEDIDLVRLQLPEVSVIASSPERVHSA